MADVKEAIRRLIYQYTVEGAEKVMATQEAVAASTTKTDKASLSLEKAFGGLERKYVDTVRAQQDYAKVQEKVNAAVAQNPQLQERANVVLAAAGQHFDNLASRAEKGSITTKLLGGAIRTLIGPAGLLGIAMTGIGTAIGYMAAQWQSSSTTIEQAMEEQNRLMKESLKLIDAKTSAQERMFAQSKAVVEFQSAQNLLDLQLKMNKAMEDAARLAERRSTTPTQVAGEMGEAPTGLAPLAAGYDKVADAVARLREAQAAGLPGIAAFNTELARIGQEYPEIAAEINKLIKANQEFGVAQEQAILKARAMADALAGVATNAQMAAAGLGSIAQFNFNNLQAQAAADALERMAQAGLQLAQLYPGMSIEAAKQLQSYDDLLRIARARGTEEELTAKQIALQNKLLNEGKSLEEALAIAAADRRVAEENIVKQKEQQAASQSRVSDEAGDTTGEIQDAGAAIQNNIQLTNQWSGSVMTLTQRWAELTIEQGVSSRLSQMGPSQFKPGGYTSSYDPLNQYVGAVDRTSMLNLAPSSNLPGQENVDTLDPFLQAQRDAFFANTKATDSLTDSTDALNATMQNILSPYYSQDPRTTKLGFRAGVMGNTDWLVPGATNANPLAVILGAGATAPGMANGGSFTVGGGYSANDNKIAAFPVASGEQVVVNRNRQGGGASVVNIDNRIIVQGSVDADTMSQLKVSRYQQAQRMRAGLSQAS